jgi:hypothetical protein
MPTREKTLQYLDLWVRAAKAGNVQELNGLYVDDAIILPTLWPQLLDNANSREEYFKFFLRNGGFQDIECREVHVQLYDGMSTASGLYDLINFDGTVINARFLFVYRKFGIKYKIVSHHSSMLPVL